MRYINNINATKKCTKCKQVLSLQQFRPIKTRNTYASWCKECHRAKDRTYYKKNREKRRKYYLENYCPDRHRNSNYKSKYGITLEQYNEMLDKQGGVCKICKSGPIYNKHLSVDHCHATGRVRGLLCGNCNTGLGKFKDDIDLLKLAISYLGASDV